MQVNCELKVTDLVDSVLYMMGRSSRFRTPDGDDNIRVIKALNEVLSSMNADNSTIPFFTTSSLPLKTDKAKYYVGIGDLADLKEYYFVDISNIGIFYNGTKYGEINKIDEYTYSNLTYDITSQGFPDNFRFYHENDVSGNTYSIFDFIYYPDKEYTCKITGKKYIAQIDDGDTIVTLPMYYREFLRLETAQRMFADSRLSNLWTPNLEKQLTAARTNITSVSKKDKRVRTINPFGDGSTYDDPRLWSTS